MWAPQQTPACVCANARRQSFWKQHELQPADARLRLLSAMATEVDSSASAEQLMATIKIALIARPKLANFDQMTKLWRRDEHQTACGAWWSFRRPDAVCLRI